MRKRLRYWIGLRRLWWGFCPQCNSSPPSPHCPVCKGTYIYGPDLTADARVTLRRRWDRLAKP